MLTAGEIIICFLKVSDSWRLEWQEMLQETLQVTLQVTLQDAASVSDSSCSQTGFRRMHEALKWSLLACVALPWLPYERLFPEMLPLPHPPNRLLVPVDVLRHQDLRERRTHGRKEG